VISINKLIIRLNPDIHIDDEELAYKSIRYARLYEQDKGKTDSIKIFWQSDGKSVVVYDKGFNDSIVYSYNNKESERQ
jgi:hypothetical protein